MAIEIGPGWTIGGGISIVQPPSAPTASWYSGGFLSTAVVSTVNRITFATDTATASVRGPLIGTVTYKPAGSTDGTTYGWVGGGSVPNTSIIQRITYATDTATASSRGNFVGGGQNWAATSGIQ